MDNSLNIIKLYESAKPSIYKRLHLEKLLIETKAENHLQVYVVAWKKELNFNKKVLKKC